ncbi:MAG: hypothetical protein V8T90_05620 [Victivallales bacterium]
MSITKIGISALIPSNKKDTTRRKSRGQGDLNGKVHHSAKTGERMEIPLSEGENRIRIRFQAFIQPTS